MPDTKDWTWVIDKPCDECGFDASTFPADGVAQLIRDNAKEWETVLARPVESLRTRPNDETWAPLEYACHVRDVFRLYDYRLGLMLNEDDPTFPNWDQDEGIGDYIEQNPAEVQADIFEAAYALANHFDAVTGDQWQRTGTRSDGAHFTVDTFARYMVHDAVHHIWDVRAAN